VTSKHAVKDASQVRLLTSTAMIPAKAVKAGAPCRAAVVGIASPALVQRRPEPWPTVVERRSEMARPTQVL